MSQRIKALYDQKHYDAAITHALDELKTTLPTLKILIASYRRKNQHNQALKYASMAAELAPDDPEIHHDLGMSYYHLKDEAKAEVHLRKAVECKATHLNPYLMMGILLSHKGQYKEANRYLSMTQSLKILDKKANLFMATNYLAMDDYLKGFALYRTRYSPFSSVRWTKLIPEKSLLKKGMDISHKTLLIDQEQGLGDIINFVRFIPLLTRQKPKKIHLCVPPALHKLLAYNYGDLCECQTNVEQIEVDYYFPIMDFPYLLGTTAQDIPNTNGYLKVDTKDSNAFYKQHFVQNKKKQIGIVWRGNPSHGHDTIRSIPLESFLTHLDIKPEDANFYSLQYKPTNQEKALLTTNSIVDLTPHINDLYDTACAIDNLDAIICVDTAVAHLSGAMNIKTYLLLATIGDWRWSPAKGGSENNWYQSVMCCRQHTLGDWRGGFESANHHLNHADL